MVRPISPETLARATRDEGMLSAIQLEQDRRNARLLAMGEQARRLNEESRFDGVPASPSGRSGKPQATACLGHSATTPNAGAAQ